MISARRKPRATAAFRSAIARSASRRAASGQDGTSRRGVARQPCGEVNPIERGGHQGVGVRVRLRLQDLGRLATQRAGLVGPADLCEVPATRTERIGERVAVDGDIGIVRRELAHEGDALRGERQGLVAAPELPEVSGATGVGGHEVRREFQVVRPTRHAGAAVIDRVRRQLDRLFSMPVVPEHDTQVEEGLAQAVQQVGILRDLVGQL